MFGGGGNNPYDDIVVKTTDENLTAENWELILNLCDKVNDEGQEGAHNVIAAILKRLAHRNANVQLYALTVAEALSKNCGIELHREIASRAFTQGLEKLITDRNSHEKVKRRALSLIAQWSSEFENDTTLGIMEDCYNSLKTKNFKFEAPEEAPPPNVDDEIRRKEEEELQRVLEMSMQDKGGRAHWQQYSLAAGDGPGASSSSGSSSKPHPSTSSPKQVNTADTTSASKAYNQPLYQSGYVPARTPSPRPQSPPQPTYQEPTPSAAAASTTSVVSAAPTTTSTVSAPSSVTTSVNIVTRVRALHTFEPTEPGELAFDKGDIIKVVDRGYKDWWRGQLKGRTGIFPVNYVEPMPEPTTAEIAKEAEQEAAVFAQAVNVEKLLIMLRSLDPAKDNLADNEEIQELYRSSMALRPKIVKLIDKYSQKRADLVSMNETFLRARSIFDRMMEESLARHTGIYDQPYRPAQYPRPDSRGMDYGATPAPQTFGWNPALYDQPGYNAYPAPAAAYGPGPGPGPVSDQPMYPSGPQLPHAQPGPTPYNDPNAYNQQSSGPQQPSGYPQPFLNHQQSYGAQGPTPYPAQQQPAPQQQQAPLQAQPQQQPQQQVPPQQQVQPAQISPQQQHFQQTPLQAQPHPTQPDITAAQPAPISPSGPMPSFSASPESSLQSQLQPTNMEPIAQAQAQAQAQPVQQQPVEQQAPQQQQGPPYVYDPNTTYADPNVQAWAQYYAHGGTDLAGAVYFVSVPGITDKAAAAPPVVVNNNPGNVQQQQQQQQQQPVAQPIQPQVEPAPAQSPSRSSSIPDPYAALAPAGGMPAQTTTHLDQSGYSAMTKPAVATTPSWVLPRHPSASVSASAPQSPAQVQPDHRNSLQIDPQTQSQYYGAPSQQFSGMSLSDNGPVPKPLGA